MKRVDSSSIHSLIEIAGRQDPTVSIIAAIHEHEYLPSVD